MSNSATISGTITGGIQDISALLPLLGTEQCEKHIGSALDGGFLYSAVTPISIFGSLGIVRASFNILAASISIPRYQFLGARVLSDGGFTLSGTVAPMIALDPRHPKRFLAESRLEAMLADEHIGNPGDLTISWAKGTVRWNFMLVAFTLVISLTGLLPYVGIILDSGDTNHTLFFPLGFGFPILRVFGSAICVIVAQFLIQLRILIIMKSRLLFLSIDQLAKEDGVKNLAFEINTGLNTENANGRWNSALAAEKCLWALQQWLSSDADMERDEKIQAIYRSEYAQQLGAINAGAYSSMVILLYFSLAIGCIATVVGYVGCFFLVQHSTNSNGPLLWLVLEASLSALRIFVWAINPSWDDSQGIEFQFQLSSNPPLLTCNRTVEEILHQNAGAYLTRSAIGLEEAVAYAGPLPSFSVQDIDVHYIFAINSQTDHSRRLLIAIYDRKELRSRLFTKETVNHSFSIYSCTLVPFKGTQFIEMGRVAQTQPNSHFLTSNLEFMAELEVHYDKIDFQLQNQESEADRRTTFGKTWDMQQPLAGRSSNTDRRPNMEWSTLHSLTDSERVYLDHVEVERRRRIFLAEMERSIDSQLMVYKESLGLTKDTTSRRADGVKRENILSSPLQQLEALEKKYLLVECQQFFELSLVCISTKFDNDVRQNHANMVKVILKPFVEKTAESAGVGGIRNRHGNTARRHRLEARFSTELELFLQQTAAIRKQQVGARVNEHLVPLQRGEATENGSDSELTRRVNHMCNLVASDTAASPIWDANLANLFRLPFDHAATFNAATPSKQLYMLLRIQRNNFIEEMENRFGNHLGVNNTGYALSINPQRNLDSGNSTKDIVKRVRARCRARGEQLFEMLASCETIGLKHFVDSPLSNGNMTSNVVRLRRNLDAISHRWNEMVTQSEERLLTIGVGSRGGHDSQTTILQYFAKKGRYRTTVGR